MAASQSAPRKVFYFSKVSFNSFEKHLIISTIILLVFNLLDLQFTLWGTNLQIIVEGNPLMQLFIRENPMYLAAFKLLLPIILGTACWKARNTSRKLVVYSMILSLLIYLLIMLMHAHWILILSF